MMLLTSQNYHSKEANKIFMSNSQYKDFLKCEAYAMAKLNGWMEPTPAAFGVGSYVHAAMEGTLDEYRAEHAEHIFNSKGKPYAEYDKADEMVRVLQADPFIRFILQGQKEVIMTANFAGAPWKIRIDNYNPEKKRFADLKTMKSIRDKHWHDKYGYVSFVEFYGYVTQMAIYAEIERIWSGRDEWLEPLIVAVSKEDVPDKEVIGFTENDLQTELDQIEMNMPRILSVKKGLEEPERCGKCRYCRETKQVRKIIHYSDLLA